MKYISWLMIVLAPVLSMAKDVETETKNIKLNETQKVALCQVYADEKFCGSKIDPQQCLKNFDFESSVKHLKGEPNVWFAQKLTLSAKNADFEFSAKVKYNVDVVNGKLTSRYEQESYSTDGKDRGSYVPEFILDASCKGDGDTED